MTSKHATAFAAAITVAAAATPSPTLAQCGSSESDHWYSAWSDRSSEDRVVWGMWSTHVNRRGDGWQNDAVLALVYDGWYAGTFRTTHGPRAYTVGVERAWASGRAGPWGGMVGFRGGLVYGYDGRLGWVAEKTPILPFVQPVLYSRIGALTTDVAYTWVAVSVTAGLRF